MSAFMSEATRLDPFPWYETMRASSPIFVDPVYGTLNVFKYADVQSALTDYEGFSSQFTKSGAFKFDVNIPIAESLLLMDPPRHEQLRALVSRAFNANSVSVLAPKIRDIASSLIPSFLSGDAMDFITEFAFPLPVLVIANMLGVPEKDIEFFKACSDKIVGGADFQIIGNMTALARFKEGQLELNEYFLKILDERRQHPGDDLISSLLKAEIEGRKLTDNELLGFCTILLVAGHETTVNLIGNAMRCLCERPDVFDHLQSNPSLVPSAIEEVLRFRSPTQIAFRFATKETELGYFPVKKGQAIILWLGSANRDEDKFSSASVFDPHRTSNRHVAFGFGIHSCLGAPLARLEGAIALELILKSMSKLKLKEGTVLEPLPSPVLHGIKHLAVDFVPNRPLVGH